MTNANSRQCELVQIGRSIKSLKGLGKLFISFTPWNSKHMVKRRLWALQMAVRTLLKKTPALCIEAIYLPYMFDTGICFHVNKKL